MRVFSLIILSLLSLTISSKGYRVHDLPSPHSLGKMYYVSNPDLVISKAKEEELNDALYNLEMTTGAQFAICVVNSIYTEDYYQFAYQLFNTWKLGSKEHNNGLLLLICKEQRTVKFETGVGLEGILTDGFLSNLLQENLYSFLRKGEYANACQIAVNIVADTLASDDAMMEMHLAQPTTKSQVTQIFIYYLVLSVFIFILLLWYLYWLFLQMHGTTNVRYNYLSRYMRFFLIMSCLFPLPNIFFIIYLLVYRRRIRRKRQRCHKCGHRMTLLNEKEEDDFLSKRQQSEESVKSIDYDVWLCKHCDHVKILPYQNVNTKFEICPNCHSKTYHVVDDRIRVFPTQYKEGTGVRTRRCENCSHKAAESYRIPRKETPVVVGTGNSGSSGFGGGSFGGGFSAGGGAGGSF